MFLAGLALRDESASNSLIFSAYFWLHDQTDGVPAERRDLEVLKKKTDRSGWRCIRFHLSAVS
jgi:hypothetical protein